MSELRGRGVTLVRLIGQETDQRWRRDILAEGLVIPTSGKRHVSLVDVTGSADPSSAIASAQRICGTEPLVAVLGLDDELPRGRLGATLVRLDKSRPGAVVRALRASTNTRLIAEAASTRIKALSASGYPFPTTRAEGKDAPVALLTEPGPSVLNILAQGGQQKLVSPLSSSQALRLLENQQAGALMIHLASDQEHRIPVLKLIRRQSELSALPVAVLADTWTDEQASNWLTAGADLLAQPKEVSAVLERLEEASNHFVCDRTTRLSLLNSSLTDDGNPSAIMGPNLFDRVVAEHQAQGDGLVIGAVQLETEDRGTEADFSEAGVYMAMALSPLDFMCRPRPDLYLVAMPYADKFYAGRTMRTLQTLIEDLKFGQEPDAVLLSARTAAAENAGEPFGETKAHLLGELAKRRSSLLQA